MSKRILAPGVSLFIILLANIMGIPQSRNVNNQFKANLELPFGIAAHREQLSEMFRDGDKRIDELITSLGSPNVDVRVNAETIIRYLGNERGMRAVYDSYEHLKPSDTFAGAPIPLPLSNWDHKWIDAHIMTNLSHIYASDMAYIYALALDHSPRAKLRLDKILTYSKGHPDNGILCSFANMKIPAAFDIEPGQLSEAVLKDAFFLSDNARRISESTLLAYNGSKDKALIEIYVGRGFLADEWYHVIVEKHGTQWRFFSIEMVAWS